MISYKGWNKCVIKTHYLIMMNKMIKFVFLLELKIVLINRLALIHEFFEKKSSDIVTIKMKDIFKVIFINHNIALISMAF